MQTRSTTEEYVELAETCLAESRRTLDRRVSEQLRIMARRYLQEAERLDEVTPLTGKLPRSAALTIHPESALRGVAERSGV